MRGRRARLRSLRLPMFFDRRHDLQPRPLIKTLLLAGAALAVPSQALSQTSASITLASSYGVRGVALNKSPVAQLRVDYDTDDGWYAGSFPAARYVTTTDLGTGTLGAFSVDDTNVLLFGFASIAATLYGNHSNGQ